MSSTVPKPPAAASRLQTAPAHGRPSTSTVHAAASSVRPESSSQARPASASISHLLSQPASFSSFVKEARRHRYEDAAAASATPMPASRPRTAQQVTFQPSVLASTNQLEDALASNILRYKGHSGQQPAPAVGSGNLAALASAGHPPPPAAVERLNRPRHPPQLNAFIDASRPPARLDAARSNPPSANSVPVHAVPQPPLEKPAAKRAPARRVVAHSSPTKQKDLKDTVVKESAAVAAGGAKKRTAKARKRAPVTVEVPSSAINVFSLDNATSELHFVGPFAKSRQKPH